jgi:hypothetical protein
MLEEVSGITTLGSNFLEHDFDRYHCYDWP